MASSEASSAGFCPKSKFYKIQMIFLSLYEHQPGKPSYLNNEVQLKPSFSPLKCSKRDKTKVCQFPFVFKGETKWDCVKGTQGPVCNVNDSEQIQTFEDTNNFHKCGECSPSVLSGSSHYKGCDLKNNGGESAYRGADSTEECQTLCDLTTGCNFFNYDTKLKWCFLKYGVGQEQAKTRRYFGQTSCQGDFEITPSLITYLAGLSCDGQSDSERVEVESTQEKGISLN